MTALRLIHANENGRAPEGDTAGSISDSGAIRAADNREFISGRAIRQCMRFLRWIADTPDAMKVDRYREAQDEGSDVLCRTCMEYPAAISGRCFRCNADRRLPC